MAVIHIFRGLTRTSDLGIAHLAGTVAVGMTGNAAFPNPPFPIADLQAAGVALEQAIGGCSQGGTHATAVKNQRREAVVGMLRELASHVELKARNDAALLHSSGFTLASTNRAAAQLAQPVIAAVFNGLNGQLLVRMKPVRNARGYEMRYHTEGGEWTVGGFATDSRSLPIYGLTPGVVYYVQVRAMGGSTSASDWSDSVTHRCM